MDLNPLLENELERKAFFINLYNVQMMDALVTQTNLPEAPTKVKVNQERKNSWNQMKHYF